jgi:hypothetical protein
MMNKKMVIFDIDGVLANFEGTLVEYLREKYGKDAFANRSMYSIEGRFANRKDILADALAFTADPNSYYGLEPIIKGVELAGALIARDYPVLFLSGRPQVAQETTIRWLRKYVEGYDLALGAACVGSLKMKRILSPEVKDLIEFVVDDNPEIVAELNKSDIIAYAWSQPWNAGTYPVIIPDNNHCADVFKNKFDKAVPFFDQWS